MFEVALFLGFPVNNAYAQELGRTDTQLLHFFLYNVEGDYLREIQHEGVRYIGKFAEPVISVESLNLLQNNILSILKKLTPQLQFNGASLTLIATPITPKSRTQESL
ncbi:MAG: hypothetical protein WCF65_03635 [Parachlamydiaceae bacterium]